MGNSDSNKKANPRVSVIIPTYNRAQLVNRAMQSVLNQTYEDFELIVVDDCSTDNTPEVVSNIGDKRIKYVRHTTNKGASASRNTGIRAARGELIGFLDSDDEWLPEKLQKQVNRFDSASVNVGLVYGGYVVVDDDTNTVVKEVYPDKRGYVFKDVLKMAGPTNPLTPLVRKECFDKVGFFDEDMRFGEDWEMWVRISQHYEFDFVSGSVGKYHVSRHQITRDSVSALEGLSKFRAKHHQILLENPAIFAHHLKWVGQRYLVDHNDYAKARSYLVQAVRVNPLEAHLYIHLLATYAVPRFYRAILKTGFMFCLRRYVAIARQSR